MKSGWLNSDDAAVVLGRGGVLLLSTDTLPGFHCRADDEAAVKRVAGIKGRDPGKPLLVLAGSLEQALQVCAELNPAQLKYCRACWPGPFSFILPAGNELAPRVSAGLGTVAIRVPDEQNIRQLIMLVGTALVSTSVNLSHEEPIRDIADAFEGFKTSVDGAWDSLQPSSSTAMASALVDLCGPQPAVLRGGPLKLPCL